MSATDPPVMMLEALRSVPLFASLDDEATRELQNLLIMRNVPRNTTLFRSGDTGDAMYLIESGRVRISVKDAEGKEVTLAELASGDFFGEMALIDSKRRSADATVIEDARLAILRREDFLALVHRNPGVALEMLSAAAERLRRTNELLRQRASRNANEEEARRLTFSDRMADVIAGFGGSWKFISVSLLFIVCWILLNLETAFDPFDPFPYILLTLILSVIATLQAPIILMSQNRQGEKDRLRADLDYQVNLKNELVLEEVLRRLEELESERLPKLSEQALAERASEKNK